MPGERTGCGRERGGAGQGRETGECETPSGRSPAFEASRCARSFSSARCNRDSTVRSGSPVRAAIARGAPLLAAPARGRGCAARRVSRRGSFHASAAGSGGSRPRHPARGRRPRARRARARARQYANPGSVADERVEVLMAVHVWRGGLGQPVYTNGCRAGRAHGKHHETSLSLPSGSWPCLGGTGRID